MLALLDGTLPHLRSRILKIRTLGVSYFQFVLLFRSAFLRAGRSRAEALGIAAWEPLIASAPYLPCRSRAKQAQQALALLHKVPMQL